MAPRSASHKTQVGELVFANNADGTSFVVLWALFLAISWLTAHPNAQISLTFVIIALFARLEFCQLCALCAGSPSELCGRPCGRTCTFTAGRATVEVAHEQMVGSDDR